MSKRPLIRLDRQLRFFMYDGDGQGRENGLGYCRDLLKIGINSCFGRLAPSR